MESSKHQPKPERRKKKKDPSLELCFICDKPSDVNYVTLANKPFYTALCKVVKKPWSSAWKPSSRACKKCADSVVNLQKAKMKWGLIEEQIQSNCMKTLLKHQQDDCCSTSKRTGSPLSSPASTSSGAKYTPSKPRPRKRLAFENVTNNNSNRECELSENCHIVIPTPSRKIISTTEMNSKLVASSIRSRIPILQTPPRNVDFTPEMNSNKELEAVHANKRLFSMFTPKKNQPP
ncbi:uncharacterized protein [Clytia hemisphaerica]|uniref:uncharacterized protein n=1 Tax=Clytia hemisphaerica TaxID=252671 RepID=UPI0034D68897